MGVIVSRQSASRLLSIRLETSGSYWDLYRVEPPRDRHEHATEVCGDRRRAVQLALESSEVNRRMMKEALAAVGLERPAAWLMQNLSPAALDANGKILGVQFTRSCYENCRRYGHLGNIDIFLNYHEAYRTGEIGPGDVALILNNSPQACWSTILVAA